MKRKILIILILIICSCGCTVKYNLNISDGMISEDIILTTTATETAPVLDESGNKTQNVSNTYKLVSTEPYYALNGKQYNLNYNDNKLEATYTYKINEYKDVKEVRTYLDLLSSEDRGSTHVIKYSNIDFFNIYEGATSLDINMTVDYPVVYNNADEVNGNTYTWHVNRNNYSEKVVKIEFEYNEEESSSDEENIINESNNYLVLAILIGAAAVIGLLIFAYISIRSKNANKL